MTVTITLKNVPPELRKELEARAALLSQSLQAYLLDELEDLAKIPTNEQVVQAREEENRRAWLEAAAEANAAGTSQGGSK